MSCIYYDLFKTVMKHLVILWKTESARQVDLRAEYSHVGEQRTQMQASSVLTRRRAVYSHADEQRTHMQASRVLTCRRAAYSHAGEQCTHRQSIRVSEHILSAVSHSQYFIYTNKNV